MLYQAIHNGADAVYLAGSLYGARRYAKNFSRDELEEVIKYAHLYGVKVYIAVNTLIYNEEVEEFLQYIEFLYKLNVDALIMQDIGMINLVKNNYPYISIHASTQCHIYSEDTIKLLKRLGVSRVVLAREMSKDKIKKIKTKVEKEVFIHGALCICFSGRCLFSSVNGGRSGNRGECVSCCRWPYTLIENDHEIKTSNKYLLSMKDLNTSSYLGEILDLNVDCLKIEGRMKSPEYVGYVTKIYRKIIDNYANNKNIVLSEEEKTKLKQLYNRKFTKGYILNDHNMINPCLQNSEGVRIGKVLEVNRNKIKIKLGHQLDQEDGIKFYNNDLGMIVNKIYNSSGKLINKGNKDEIVYIDNKVNLKTKDIVHKTISRNLNEELSVFSKKKIAIKVNVIAKINKKLIIEFSDYNNIVRETGDIVLKATNKSVTKEDIQKYLSRLGDTPYIINEINLDVDNNIFIPYSKLNIMRRLLVSKLSALRTNVNNKIIKKDYKYVLSKKDRKLRINVLVRTEEHLQAVIDKVDNIYVDDYDLYLKYRDNEKIFYKTSGVEEEYKDINNSNILVSDLGAINKYAKTNYVVSDYTLNIVNNYSVSLMESLGVKRVCLSCELDYDKIVDFDLNLNIEVLIYGKIEIMITKECPKKDLISCNSCIKNDYYLKNNNKMYKLIRKNCYNYIYNYQNLDMINKIKSLKGKGICNFRLDFLDEDVNEVIKIITMVREELDDE